ncbi:Hypothetical predicted protein [Paramuricea clavata]|uniref:Uncharacterized protein n=1 Tax=Paramuricea clavata TaxID=317549 RepID=A0A6S7GUC2_PARCT|nr:Hypothetical predicted protein [Paramuricea clavata]
MLWLVLREWLVVKMVMVGRETAVGCEDVVVGSETAVGCEDVVVGTEMVVGCDDVVKTGGIEGCSNDQEVIEHNARIVEVIEDIGHDNGLNLTEANITDKGTQLKKKTDTKQGQKLAYILGLTEELSDKKYLDILPVMETKISQEQSRIKQQLRQREQQHFDKTGKLLTSKTLLKDPTSKLLMDKLKYCKALVDQWKLEKK